MLDSWFPGLHGLWAVCGEVEHCGEERGVIKCLTHDRQELDRVGVCPVTHFFQLGPTSTSFEPLPVASLSFEPVSGVMLIKSKFHDLVTPPQLYIYCIGEQAINTVFFGGRVIHIQTLAALS